MPITFQDGPEARQWLQNNRSAAGLAGNRFSSTAEALDFVEQLYAARAVRVFVPQDSIRDHAAEIRDPGGPYSDTLVFEVSPDSDRQRLLELVSAESEHEGYAHSTSFP